MEQHDSGLPTELRLRFEASPPASLRASLAQAINDFHARSVPPDSGRFALSLHDAEGRLAGALVGVLSWQWLFVEALWIADAWRGRGLGRALMARAEAHARAEACHSAWLDTFQAHGFYAALGYREFAALEDYPPGQTRHFLRKRL
jgi:GNAT superfamily N-acetyltransferase